MKSVSVENDYQQNDTLPQHIFEAIEKYGESLKPEHMISKEEFFANARKKYASLILESSQRIVS